MTQFKAGYLRDPAKKPGQKPDRNFTTELLPRLSLSPGDVDFRPNCTETNQASASSCVGNSTGDSLEVLNSLEGLPPVQLSRMFIYALCRQLMDEDNDGHSDINRDEGTYIRLAFDVLSRFGVCREDLPVSEGGWPYDLSKLHVLPSIKAMRAATGHRIHSYYRIWETGYDRVEKIHEALQGRHPVVFGTQIDSSFLKVKDATPVGPPRGTLIGGHAMIVVGYIAGKGFIIKNSWGKSWGEGGFCFMEPEYLAWTNTYDLWVPTKGMAFK